MADTLAGGPFEAFLGVGRHVARTLEGRLGAGEEPATLQSVRASLLAVEEAFRKEAVLASLVGRLRVEPVILEAFLGLPEGVEILGAETEHDDGHPVISFVLRGIGMPRWTSGAEPLLVNAVYERGEDGTPRLVSLGDWTRPAPDTEATEEPPTC